MKKTILILSIMLILIFLEWCSRDEKVEEIVCVETEIIEIFNYRAEVKNLDALRYIQTHTRKNEVSLDDALLIVESVLKYNNTVLTTAEILAILAQESEFNKNAVNRETKDFGLAQINLWTFREVCKENKLEYNVSLLFDVEYNIKIMMMVLKQKEKRITNRISMTTDDLRIALIMSYNAGVGGYFAEYHGRSESEYFKLIQWRLGILNKIDNM